MKLTPDQLGLALLLINGFMFVSLVAMLLTLSFSKGRAGIYVSFAGLMVSFGAFITLFITQV